MTRVIILGVVANYQLDTAQIRDFLVATEKDAWKRVYVARDGLAAIRTDTLEYARRNYDTATAQTQQWIGQAKQVWTENSENFVQTVKEAWRKQRG